MDDLAKFKDLLNKTDVKELCSRAKKNTVEILQVEKPNSVCSFTQRRTYGLQNAVSPKLLLKNYTINRLIFEENTSQLYKDNFCLFCALAFHFHGNQNLEEEITI